MKTASTTYARPELHTYLDSALEDPHHNALMSAVVSHFGLSPGDAVVEIGAGSGRYTHWLLRYGLRVTAIEPDPQLVDKLRQRLAGARHLRVVASDLTALRAAAIDTRAVCGFHVLHHLDAPALTVLAEILTEIRAQQSHFAGWFFLEPNPRNLLYPLQILTTRGMRFAEEAGIWRNDYRSAFAGAAGGIPELGTIGLLPPRPGLKILPAWMLAMGTALKRGRSWTRLYTLYGSDARPCDPRAAGRTR